MKSLLTVLITLCALLLFGSWLRGVINGGHWGTYLLTLCAVGVFGYVMSSDADKRRYRRLIAWRLGAFQPWRQTPSHERRTSDD